MWRAPRSEPRSLPLPTPLRLRASFLRGRRQPSLLCPLPWARRRQQGSSKAFFFNSSPPQPSCQQLCSPPGSALPPLGSPRRRREARRSRRSSPSWQGPFPSSSPAARAGAALVFSSPFPRGRMGLEGRRLCAGVGSTLGWRQGAGRLVVSARTTITSRCRAISRRFSPELSGSEALMGSSALPWEPSRCGSGAEKRAGGRGCCPAHPSARWSASGSPGSGCSSFGEPQPQAAASGCAFLCVQVGSTPLGFGSRGVLVGQGLSRNRRISPNSLTRICASAPELVGLPG